MIILDISGYSFTGKSAYFDLITSCQHVKSFSREDEIELFRVRGGLYDLYLNTTNPNWSLIRSSNSVKDYLQLISNLGFQRNFLSRMFSHGLYYEDLFPGFNRASIKFVSQVVSSTYKGYWPYYQLSRRNSFLSTLLSKLKPSPSLIYLSRICPGTFEKLAVEYTDSLFATHRHSSTSAFVISNAFETSCPESFLPFFSDAKSIVIDRDPRAIYASAYIESKTKKNPLVASATIGNSPSDFINRFLMQRRMNSCSSPNVLRMMFEDLVTSPDYTIATLSHFLGFELLPLPGRSFSLPYSSTQPWLTYNDKTLNRHISYIEENLSSYCISC